MKQVMVSHPGLQHSHQLAWALWERDLLLSFWSGVPVLAKGEKIPYFYPQTLLEKLKEVPIPSEYRCHPILFPATLKFGNLLPGMTEGRFMHLLCHYYDKWISSKMIEIRPKVVVAYENSAYHTFRAAKSIGAKCILDAASLHYAVGRQLQLQSKISYDWVDEQKRQEIAMADLILTCSPLAADSYRIAGVDTEKIRTVLLGAELSINKESRPPHNRTLSFLFAGALRHLKAIDVILSVFRRLHLEGIAARILFVGGLAEPRWKEEIRKTPNADYHPGVAQAQLFEMFAEADCLLLPSRFDSFGMVVAEAMACGTPAIVSNMTGAKAMIEQFPGSGWIVEPTVESLYQCVRERLENRAELFAARSCAREAARHFSWQGYRERVGRVIQEFVDS